MQSVLSSTLLLTLLLTIGLVFFLRAASKDRTTVIDIQSPRPPLEILNGLTLWLEARGWKRDGGNAERQTLRFIGEVESSRPLAIFLSMLGGLGAGCLGLVIKQLYPVLEWWPLLLICFGPFAGFVYHRRAKREEFVELRLMSIKEGEGSMLRLRAHRDELIALESELSSSLNLVSNGSLVSSPI